MRFRVATTVALLGVLAACGGGSDGVVVFAASSLTDVFGDLEAAFEADRDIDIVVSYGGSSTLATQIDQMPPAHRGAQPSSPPGTASAGGYPGRASPWANTAAHSPGSIRRSTRTSRASAP
jgi:molybdate transport system substrate-binding protein